MLSGLARQLDEHLGQQARAKDDLLRSIPGVGNVTTRTLRTKCPELGKLNRCEIALWWVLPPGE